MKLEDLIKISRCNNCGEKGHWKRECPNPPREKGTSRESRDRRGQVGFVCVLGETGREVGATWLSADGWANRMKEILKKVTYREDDDETGVYLNIKAGWAVVDTAAGQALIGLRAARQWDERLQAKGIKMAWRAPRGPRPTGVGGGTELINTVVIPVALAGTP